MPRLKNALPKYRKHRASGQAVVRIAGKEIYLGKYGTKASRQEYDRLVGEWAASGRPVVQVDQTAPTVAEIILAYIRHAQSYYVKNGRQTDEVDCIKAALKHLRALYGRTPACEFGPLRLVAVRERMVGTGICRSYVNKQVGRIRRMFTWATSQELLPPAVAMALQAVPGLREGRTKAIDHPPVMPVADHVVEATLPALPPAVVAMIELQKATGMRPEEVCAIAPAQIDRKGDVWVYRLESHKMTHKGRERTVFIGPRGQASLTPYLFGDGPCFLNCRRRPYNTRSYRDAIHRAVQVVNRGRRKRREPDLPKWCPNQLRHGAATVVRAEYGVEGAQIILGHARADVTQVYAERDWQKAVEIAREVG